MFFAIILGGLYLIIVKTPAPVAEEFHGIKRSAALLPNDSRFIEDAEQQCPRIINTFKTSNLEPDSGLLYAVISDDFSVPYFFKPKTSEQDSNYNGSDARIEPLQNSRIVYNPYVSGDIFDKYKWPELNSEQLKKIPHDIEIMPGDYRGVKIIKDGEIEKLDIPFTVSPGKRTTLVLSKNGRASKKNNTVQGTNGPWYYRAYSSAEDFFSYIDPWYTQLVTVKADKGGIIALPDFWSMHIPPEALRTDMVFAIRRYTRPTDAWVNVEPTIPFLKPVFATVKVDQYHARQSFGDILIKFLKPEFKRIYGSSGYKFYLDTEEQEIVYDNENDDGVIILCSKINHS